MTRPIKGDPSSAHQAQKSRPDHRSNFKIQFPFAFSRIQQCSAATKLRTENKSKEKHGQRRWDLGEQRNSENAVRNTQKEEMVEEAREMASNTWCDPSCCLYAKYL